MVSPGGVSAATDAIARSSDAAESIPGNRRSTDPSDSPVDEEVVVRVDEPRNDAPTLEVDLGRGRPAFAELGEVRRGHHVGAADRERLDPRPSPHAGEHPTVREEPHLVGVRHAGRLRALAGSRLGRALRTDAPLVEPDLRRRRIDTDQRRIRELEMGARLREIEQPVDARGSGDHAAA